VIKELSGQGHALATLLEVSGIPSSTYHYNRDKAPKGPTRPDLAGKAVEIFSRTANGCGHRQVAMCLRSEAGAKVSDKTVLKMMRELGLRCLIRGRSPYKSYSSYKGEVGKTFENLLKRDFSADAPWQKLGTDVTEFKQPWGKAYLAPTLDFGSREVVAWAVSKSPNMAQQKEMLDMLVGKLPEGATPIMTSDMGWQYQHRYYTGRLAGAGITQAMSRKGNCIDNAPTEGFFGHLKDEFFRGREWPDFESFKADLEAYLVHWNTRRRQKALKGLTPEEFRIQSLQTAA
jgi:transposase InsO family protein